MPLSGHPHNATVTPFTMRGLLHHWIVCGLGLLLLTAGVSAQTVPASVTDQVTFLAATLSELLSDTRSFTANAEMQLPAAPPDEAITLRFGTAMRDGLMRWDLGVNQLSAWLEPEMLQQFRAAKVDRVLFFLQSEQPARVVIPGLPGYAETPLKNDSPLHAQAGAAIGHLQKVEVGREVIDGHPCVKYRLWQNDNNGKAIPGRDAAVWQATDLNNLPIQLAVRMPQGLWQFRFRKIRMTRPDEKYFQIPASYTRYPDNGALLQAATAKALGAGGWSRFFSVE